MLQLCLFHPPFSHPQHGRIDFNTISPSLPTGIHFLFHPSTKTRELMGNLSPPPSRFPNTPLFWWGTDTIFFVHRHTRQSFDRLADLFSDRDNWARLRDHMNSIALKHAPCIPYLGLYLTDLMMVDIAHPSSGGIDSDHRQFKMNNILRLLSELQQSSYDNLSVITTIQEYLSDVRYIDELQKFLEDDQFKLSERLEPNSPQPSSTSSKESVRSVRPVQSQHPDLLQELNLSPAKRSGASRGQRFVPGHRKSKSEGGNIFFSCAGSGLASPEVQQGKARVRGGSCDSLEAEKASHYSLLDGSLLDDNSPCSTLPPGTLAPPPGT